MMKMKCEFDFTEFRPECLSFYVSKVLGSLVLLGSLAVKLPQIINIVMTKDIIGLSPSAFYTEVPLSITSIVYNYLQGNPFISYGETCIISVQNVVLVLLLWMYMKPAPSLQTILTVILVFIAVACISFNLPVELQYLLPLATLPLILYSRGIQIYSNYSMGTTGQLSLITTLLQFAGSLVRIFTTIQEVGLDLSLLAVISLSVILNGILMTQVRVRR